MNTKEFDAMDPKKATRAKLLEGPELCEWLMGVSAWLDRNASVEAIGDSNPPGMATVIGRAILQAA